MPPALTFGPRRRPAIHTVRAFFRDYGLSVTLACFFILSWLVQTVAGWVQFVAEQQEHGQVAEAFGPEGYAWPWLQATFENWQSEFLQLFAFVVLTTFLIHRKSPESRDDQEKMANQIEQILHKVEALEQKKG
jgi:hypothetical protein